MLICDKHRSAECYGDIDQLELVIRTPGKLLPIASFDLCGEAVRELLGDGGLIEKTIAGFLQGERGHGPQTTHSPRSGPGAGGVPGPGPQVTPSGNPEGLQTAEPAIPKGR